VHEVHDVLPSYCLRRYVTPERKARLDTIGFVWDEVEEKWELGFEALLAFRVREGHCRVPSRHVEGEINLGIWVRGQRENVMVLSADHKARWDEIGFVWKPVKEGWEQGFAALVKFKQREGHCRVPAVHEEEKFRLGVWVGRQRLVRDTILAERKVRLDEIGFVWEPLKDAWEPSEIAGLELSLGT
jgi:hypothetical protein